MKNISKKRNLTRLRDRNKSPRKSFTLLEILICLAILSFASVVFLIEGKNLFDSYRFKNTLSLLRAEVERTKFQSLVYRTDIELELIFEKGGFYLYKRCDEPIFSKCKPIALPGICKVKQQNPQGKNLSLVKFSSGYCIEEKILDFWKNKDYKEQFSCNFLLKPSPTEKKSR